METSVQERRWWELALLLCVFLIGTSWTTGCAKKTLEPEKIYRQYFQVLQVYSQDQQAGYREVAFEFLSSSSRKRLESRAEAINATLPENAHIAPFDLLLSVGTPFGAPIVEISRLEESAERVVLKLTFVSAVSQSVLVLEDSTWKIELPPIPTQDTASSVMVPPHEED